MSKISPKIIDVEGNRIETNDRLFRKITQRDRIEYVEEILYYDVRNKYNETSRFPTQLFVEYTFTN